MNAKQKFLTVTAVWIALSMVLSLLGVFQVFSGLPKGIISVVNKLVMMFCFIVLFTSSALRWHKAARLGIATYIVGLIGSLVKIYVEGNNLLHDALPEQAFAALTHISVFNILYLTLGFATYYRISQLAKQGSLLRFSALMMAWCPLLIYLVFLSAAITRGRFLWGMSMGSLYLVSSFLSVVISHLFLIFVVLSLRKELLVSKTGNNE